MTKFIACGLALILGSAGLSAVRGANWPQWRGPQRNGLSAETGLLQSWPREGPRLRWQVKDCGTGYSTPAVVDDRIYLLGSEGTTNEFVQARSVSDGHRIWATRIGRVGANQGPQYPGARSTPTVDGEQLFALGSDGDLVCVAAATGGLVWSKNLRTDFKGMPGNWAYAESPLVDGDVLLCTPGGTEATLVALEKKTGNVVWKSAIPGGDQAAYASAQVVEAGGVKQYVQFLQKGLVGVDAKSGRFLWRYDKTAQGSPANIPTPVARGSYIYCAAGRTGGGLVRLKSGSGRVSAEEVYFSAKLPTAIGGAVLVGDYLYGTTGQALLCVEFVNGRVKWEERSVAPGSLCAADGRLYLHGENGEMALVEATAAGYRERGRFTPPDPPDHGVNRAKAWAYPVVVQGLLFVRDLGTMWCYAVGAGQEHAAARAPGRGRPAGFEF